MTRSASLSYLLLVAVSVSAAHAATPASGAVGTLQLFDEVKVSPLPDEGATDDAKRTTWALDYATKGGGVGRAALYQSCGPHIGKISTTDRGIETLATASTIAGGFQMREPSRWTTLASQRAYRTEGLRGQSVLISQWLVPTDNALASIRFERAMGAPVEREVMAAIEQMQFTCGAAAAVTAEG